MSDLLLTTLLVGLLYAPYALGSALSFRVLDFPDLTIEGSALFAGAVAWRVLDSGGGWALSLCAAVTVGALAGVLTSTLHGRLRAGALLSGLIVASVLYAAFFRVTGGYANRPVRSELSTLFDALGARDALPTVGLLAVVVAALALGISWLFTTRAGRLLRSIGDEPRMVQQLGRSLFRWRTAGLAIANALIGLGAGMLVNYHRVIDASAVGGILIATLAAIMLGESVFRPARAERYPFAIVGGSIIYATLMGVAFVDWSDAWISLVEATDVRGIAGVLFLASTLVSRRRRGITLFSTTW